MVDFSSIPVVSYVFFAIFILVSLIHLLFCYEENELWRKITKPMCVGSLLVAVICYIPQYPLVYVGLACGLLGDIFLLKKHKVWPFVLGMISFLINHILNIIQYIILSGATHYSYYVATGVGVALLVLFGYRVCNKIVRTKPLAFGGDVYLCSLVYELTWAIICCARGRFDFLFLGVLGGICFIISDVYLAYTSFVSNKKRRDFYIMATYLLAQTLIALGFCFTLMAA